LVSRRCVSMDLRLAVHRVSIVVDAEIADAQRAQRKDE